MTEVYLAIDFGGGSGRVIAGYPSEGELVLDTVYRFPNRQIKLGNCVYWDFLSLFEDMKRGIRMAHEKGYRIRSIGIDTWGVDFGLIDKHGNLLGNPVCYRDRRTEGMPEEVFSKIDPAVHYRKVGTQVMSINTLFQLYAMQKENNSLLEVADKLLFMPDLFSYFLTGVANNEYSIASTSELLDARSRQWDWSLIAELGLPARLFGEIVMPGSRRGKVKKEITSEWGIDYDIDVIAVASHDTASAVYAIAEKDKVEEEAFLSSGTWSLLGKVLDEPVLTEEARIAGFTNEGGGEGKICFLQNITGLWIFQRLLAQWADEGKETAYEQLIPMAGKADIATVIDVDDALFQNPSCMTEAIRKYCVATAQVAPVSQGEYVRCILQSLAERYRKGVEELNRMLPKPVTCLRIIGGGSQNRLLNELTEKATGLKVTTGPVEATAIGNIKMQMKSI